MQTAQLFPFRADRGGCALGAGPRLNQLLIVELAAGPCCACVSLTSLVSLEFLEDELLDDSPEWLFEPERRGRERLDFLGDYSAMIVAIGYP